MIKISFLALNTFLKSILKFPTIFTHSSIVKAYQELDSAFFKLSIELFWIHEILSMIDYIEYSTAFKLGESGGQMSLPPVRYLKKTEIP